MMRLCQKGLVWSNYLKFVQTSLRIVIGKYLKKRRMLFRKGIFFRKCHEYDEVVLWNSFELFDQLHIMQLLDGFTKTRDNFQHLSVIFIDDFLGRVSIESLPHSGLKRENRFQKNNSFLDNLAGKLLRPRPLNRCLNWRSRIPLFYRFCRAACYVFLRNYLQRGAD